MAGVGSGAWGDRIRAGMTMDTSGVQRLDFGVPEQRAIDSAHLDELAREAIGWVQRSVARGRHLEGAEQAGNLNLAWAIAVLQQHLDPGDQVRVSPSAKPLADVVGFLTNDPEAIVLSTAPVEPGAAAMVFAAAVRDYVDGHFGPRPSCRFVALLSGQDLDDPTVWHAVATAAGGRASVLWVVDLDQVGHAQVGTWRSRLAAAHWQVLDVRHRDATEIHQALLAADADSDRPSVLFVHPGQPLAVGDLRPPLALPQQRRRRRVAADVTGPQSLNVPGQTRFRPTDPISTELAFDIVAEALGRCSGVGAHLVPTGAILGHGGTIASEIIALTELGLSRVTSGQVLLPVGMIADPADRSEIESLISAASAGSRFLVIGQSEAEPPLEPLPPAEAASLPGLTRMEPAYAAALDWMLCSALADIATDSARPGAAGAFHLRLSARSIDQTPFEDARERLGAPTLRAQVLAGGYRLRETPGAVVQLVGAGAVVPEMLDAADELGRLGIDVHVVELTSADRFYLGWQRARNRRDQDNPLDGVLDPIPVVSVHDHSAPPMPWLTYALRTRTKAVNVAGAGPESVRLSIIDAVRSLQAH